MALDGESEKLKLAGEWLCTAPLDSQEWDAAYEHVTWVLRTTTRDDLREKAKAITDIVTADGFRAEERRRK